MDRHSIGQFQLGGGIQFVQDEAVVVHQHRQDRSAAVHPAQHAHVPVEHTFAGGTVRFVPREVVVVFDLHHLVAFAKQHPIDRNLILFAVRRVQRSL